MDAPPKQLDTEIRRIAKTHDGRRVVRSAATIRATIPNGADSMPVLSAFNQFLEAERKNARRRMAALSAFFVFILLGLSGGLFYIGFELFSQTQADLADLQNDMREYRQALAEVSPDKIRGMINRQHGIVESELLSAIDETRRKTIETSRTLLEEKLAEREREVENLREMLSEIDIENSRRRREAAAIRAELQAVMQSLRSKPATLVDMPPARATTTTPLRRPAPRPQPHLTVPVEVRGQRAAFRLPIPE